MQTLNVGELKSKFSEVLKRISSGETIAIAYGKKKEIIARIVPEVAKKQKRKIGILEGKAHATFDKHFQLTEEDFIGL